jgi:hypothetical protein
MDRTFIDALTQIPGALLAEGDWVPLTQAPLRYRERIPPQILDAIDAQTVAPIALEPITVGDVTSAQDLVDEDRDSYLLPDGDAGILFDIEDFGLEAIAYYVSFHVRPHRWGIFLSVERLEQLAAEVFDPLPATDAEKLLIAYQMVIDHELFHYWTDIAATEAEFVTRLPVYLPYLRLHPDLSSPLAQIEEALANARAWRRLRTKEAKAHAGAAMDLQPPGYRDWSNYRSPRAFLEGKRELGIGIDASVGARPPLRGSPHEWFFDERRPGANSRLVPLFLIPAQPGRGKPYYQAHQRPITIHQTEKFEKALRKIPASVREAWDEIKTNLEGGIWGGSKFGPLKGRKGVFRAKVGRDYRAFLEERSGDVFEAVDIRPRQGAYR